MEKHILPMNTVNEFSDDLHYLQECELCKFHLGDELSLEHTHRGSVHGAACYPYRRGAPPPGRRDFEWVKWIILIEVLTEVDPGQVVSIFTSSFTDAGRGN